MSWVAEIIFPYPNWFLVLSLRKYSAVSRLGPKLTWIDSKKIMLYPENLSNNKANNKLRRTLPIKSRNFNINYRDFSLNWQ